MFYVFLYTGKHETLKKALNSFKQLLSIPGSTIAQYKSMVLYRAFKGLLRACKGFSVFPYVGIVSSALKALQTVYKLFLCSVIGSGIPSVNMAFQF